MIELIPVYVGFALIGAAWALVSYFALRTRPVPQSTVCVLGAIVVSILMLYFSNLDSRHFFWLVIVSGLSAWFTYLILIARDEN